MKKTIQASLLTLLTLAVLCAGTLSARQLRAQAATSPVCGGICSAKISCSSSCFCNIPVKQKQGTCILPPAFRPAR